MSADRFWLVTTEHLTNGLWFRDEEDFKAGMNLVAALSVLFPIKICSFILMSNHVHFILYGMRKDVEAFVLRLKKQHSQYFSHKYGGKKRLLRSNEIDIKELSIEDESFHRAFAYVQMNSASANLSLHSADYKWGTGNTFFRTDKVEGIKAKELSARKIARKVHSRINLPDNFIFNRDGYIDPSSYVPVRFIESIFRSLSRMRFFLNSSSKARNIRESPSFSDQIVIPAMKELSISLFRKRDMGEMDDKMKAELLKQVRYRFSSDINQLSRISGLSYDSIVQLLDTF